MLHLNELKSFVLFEMNPLWYSIYFIRKPLKTQDLGGGRM